ncbi:MAG TPA: hypothetical protein VI076_15975 [Actinopolymorphaceae bacterium]
MQATVRSYDPGTRAGTVLLDDGVEVPYDGTALELAGLRHLRIGQRVQVELAGRGADTVVARLSVYTLR